MSKGFGFVRFGEEEEKDTALSTMNGVTCGSRSIRVAPATAKKAGTSHPPTHPPTHLPTIQSSSHESTHPPTHPPTYLPNTTNQQAAGGGLGGVGGWVGGWVGRTCFLFVSFNTQPIHTPPTHLPTHPPTSHLSTYSLNRRRRGAWGGGWNGWGDGRTSFLYVSYANGWAS